MAIVELAGRGLRPVAVAVALPLLAACGGPSLPSLVPQPEQELRSRPAEAYPNINLAPDRPSRARPSSEARELESELEQLGDEHADTAEQQIQRSGRGS